MSAKTRTNRDGVMKLQELVRTESVRRRSSLNTRNYWLLISNNAMALENTDIQDTLEKHVKNVSTKQERRYFSFEILLIKIKL
jgi:hypothetical protein